MQARSSRYRAPRLERGGGPTNWDGGPMAGQGYKGRAEGDESWAIPEKFGAALLGRDRSFLRVRHALASCARIDLFEQRQQLFGRLLPPGQDLICLGERKMSIIEANSGGARKAVFAVHDRISYIGEHRDSATPPPHPPAPSTALHH